MKRQKLHYRFHDPNPAETAADFLLKIFIAANREKAERAVQDAQLAAPPGLLSGRAETNGSRSA